MPWFFVAGILTTVAGALFYAAVNASTPASHIYGFSVILAVGAGLTQQTAYSVAPSKVGPNRVPEALGFINMAQIGGMVIGLTLSSAVFQNVGVAMHIKCVKSIQARQLKDDLWQIA